MSKAKAVIILRNPQTGERAGRLTAGGKNRKSAVAAVRRLAAKFGIPVAKNPGLVDSIRAGDRVTIRTPQGQERTGRAVMPSSGGGWVLNLGGRHGTPGIANDRNTIKVRPSGGKSRPRYYPGLGPDRPHRNPRGNPRRRRNAAPASEWQFVMVKADGHPRNFVISADDYHTAAVRAISHGRAAGAKAVFDPEVSTPLWVAKGASRISMNPRRPSPFWVDVGGGQRQYFQEHELKQANAFAQQLADETGKTAIRHDSTGGRSLFYPQIRRNAGKWYVVINRYADQSSRAEIEQSERPPVNTATPGYDTKRQAQAAARKLEQHGYYYPRHRNARSGRRTRCECSDPGCPVKHGSKECGRPSAGKVYRSDMEDRTGTAMCADCAADALESGVFYTK